MNKLVYSVFKAIMIAIIFVFVFDMASYLYRAVSLNTRMESISTSLKKVVMENNYLPSEDATLYQNLLAQIIVDFNGATSYTIAANGNLTITDPDHNDDFISGMHWNFGSDAVGISSSNLLSLTGQVYTYTSSGWTTTSRTLVEKDMSKPREYGDVQIVQLRVGVYQPLWGWGMGTLSTDYSYNGEDSSYWNVNRVARGTEFTYTYYVPCLKYKSTNTY